MKTAASILVVFGAAFLLGATYIAPPQTLPASPADVTTKTTYVDVMTLSCLPGAAGNTVTVTVQDKQTSPQVFLAATPMTCPQTWILQLSGRSFPGGITWSASAGSSISGSIRGQQ